MAPSETPYVTEHLGVAALRKDGAEYDEQDVAVLVVDQKKQKQSWLGYFWDTADLPPAERKLLFKVDASLLIFASLGYFIKNLDQTNTNTAFLSGMKEDLNMYGNELVTSTTVWTVGYVVGQIPSNLLLTRIPPHIVIPALELGWGIATLGTYAVKDVKALYALRFLVGLFESGFYPGMHYLLSSWYTSRELTKRSTIFWTAGSLGTMFSVIDAIITIPIALLGYLFLPDSPWDAKPTFLLSAADIELARARMKATGRAEAEPWSKAKFKRIFTSWHIYVFPLLYVIWNNSFIQQPMGQATANTGAGSSY
ncbi:hypothetical protein RQP46_004714 [Phenoliferia psychrophenolica]